jgi:hypothetical protein
MLQGSIYWKISPWEGGGISADVIWGKKCEEGKRKRGKMQERGKKKDDRGKKKIEWK